MSYYCHRHGAYVAHSQFLNQEHTDSSYISGIQRNGSLMNIHNYNQRQVQVNASPPYLYNSTDDGFYNNMNQFYVNQQTNQSQDFNNTQEIYSSPTQFTETYQMHEKRYISSRSKANNRKSKLIKKNQKLFIVRHGERVDTTFGSLWIKNAFKTGEYNRFNLNMPKKLPKRGDINDFAFDPPLTEIGMYQAKLHGEELARKEVKISHIYSSPALRSIQTADKILEGMGMSKTVPIRIETGLFELLSWQNYIPKKYPFMDSTLLIKNGYNIDSSYMSVVPYHTLSVNETEESYYNRSYFMTKAIVDRHALDGENIMFVGHAPTIEGCSRQLVGFKPRSVEDFVRINMRVPFLSILECEKNSSTGSWSIVSPSIQTMRHTEMFDFNWNDVKSQRKGDNKT